MLYMSLESKIRSLKAHPLIQVLADNGGNPRTLVLIEPLWGVPYNLIAPFATLYMYTQGITDVQIGLIRLRHDGSPGVVFLFGGHFV